MIRLGLPCQVRLCYYIDVWRVLICDVVYVVIVVLIAAACLCVAADCADLFDAIVEFPCCLLCSRCD